MKCQLCKNKKTKESRGFGFIDFEKITSTQKCLAIEEHFYDDRKFNCKAAIPIEGGGNVGESQQDKKLWVGELDPDWTDAKLKDYFCKFGDIETCYIARKKGSEVSRKFGFIFFKDRESVEKVLETPKHIIDCVHIAVRLLKTRITWAEKNKLKKVMSALNQVSKDLQESEKSSEEFEKKSEIEHENSKKNSKNDLEHENSKNDLEHENSKNYSGTISKNNTESTKDVNSEMDLPVNIPNPQSPSIFKKTAINKCS